LILLLHASFYLVYWVSIGGFRRDVDQFIINLIQWNLPYTTIMMILTVMIGLWSLMRVIGFRLASRKNKWKPTYLNWVYFSLWVVFLVVIYGTFVIILRINPSQRGVLFHLFNLTRLVGDALMFLLAGMWLRRLILYLRRKMIHSYRQWPWALSIMMVLIFMIGLWLIPALFPPNWAYQGDLPAKPALMAHRGASMIAPENTLAAVEAAAVNQAFGFETDVRISLDGEPFLMHDETLERTTNIAEVFPDRVTDQASNFTVNELKQLNAGLWFIQKDPFDTINAGLVSQNQLSINQGQGIPTLSESLALVEKENMVILFDMRFPSQDHPYYNEFFDIVLTKCQESGMNGDVWFLADPDDLEKVIESAPQFTRVIGVSSTNLPVPAHLLDLKYEIINVDTGIRTCEIQAYREKGLGVNVYTIDQPWLFSQFWLSGVTSVTTNNVHTLSHLERPFLNLPYSRYILFWGLFGIIVAIWLANNQPEHDREVPEQMVTPDLMDFAEGEDHAFNTHVDPTAPEWVHGEEEEEVQVEPDERL